MTSCSSPILGFGRRTLIGVLAVCSLTAIACGGSDQRPARKAAGSAIWLSSSSEPLQPNVAAKLREAGVEEVFLQSGRLDPATGDVVVSGDAISLPGGLACTVTFTGSFKGSAEPAGPAEKIFASFRELQARVEQEDALVVGLHLDFTSVDSLESYGLLLQELRKKLGPKLYLSVTVQRSWLGDEALKLALEPADFFVPFLYGQRIEEKEDPEAWDLSAIEKSLQAAEALNRPYMLGVIGLGTATWNTASGTIKERITRLSMQDLVRNPDLQLRPGFSLEGTNRRVYVFEAQRKTTVGEWSLANEDSVRIIRVAASDLEELLRRLDLWGNPNRIGQVYLRIPHAEERLSLGAESLASALKLDSKSLDLKTEVAVQRRTGRGWLVRFSLINSSGGFSELALLDNNYLEIKIESGHYGGTAVAGDFQRYDLLREIGGRRERTFRSPDILRLYVPMLEGQQKVVSGDIEVITNSAPTFSITGKFLLPEGKNLNIGPFTYKNGILEEISSTPTE